MGNKRGFRTQNLKTAISECHFFRLGKLHPLVGGTIVKKNNLTSTLTVYLQTNQISSTCLKYKIKK